MGVMGAIGVMGAMVDMRAMGVIGVMGAIRVSGEGSDFCPSYVVDTLAIVCEPGRWLALNMLAPCVGS